MSIQSGYKHAVSYEHSVQLPRPCQQRARPTRQVGNVASVLGYTGAL